MSNSNNAVNGDMDKSRNNKNKNSKKTLKSNIPVTNDEINAGKDKPTQSHKDQTGNSTVQKKKSITKNSNDQQGKFADKEIEKRLRMEHEERAKAEAERKVRAFCNKLK